ncbi:MAG TPA: CsbD family protein [Beijerinckiaceae bacterium]|nr:CsbD family protein [Beijerinckiaceae bacterium]
MNKDRVEGAATEARGNVKEASGKVTGDQKLQAEGMLDCIKGRIQNLFGRIKDRFGGK